MAIDKRYVDNWNSSAWFANTGPRLPPATAAQQEARTRLLANGWICTGIMTFRRDGRVATIGTDGSVVER